MYQHANTKSGYKSDQLPHNFSGFNHLYKKHWLYNWRFSDTNTYVLPPPRHQSLTRLTRVSENMQQFGGPLLEKTTNSVKSWVLFWFTAVLIFCYIFSISHMIFDHWVMHNHYTALYTHTKFHKKALNTFSVIIRTNYCDKQTDRQTDVQMDRKRPCTILILPYIHTPSLIKIFYVLLK